MNGLSRVSTFAFTVLFGGVCSGCTSDDASPPAGVGGGGTGGSGGIPTGGTGGTGTPMGGAAGNGGTSGGAGGSAPSGGTGGSGSSGKAPDGFTLTPGLTIVDSPDCSGSLSVSCSGYCATTSQEMNGCQALGIARIVSDLARDDDGMFMSFQGSGSSTLSSVDAASGTLVELARPPGDNMHPDLALDATTLYFDSNNPRDNMVNNTLYAIPRAGGEITELLPGMPNSSVFVVTGGRLYAKIALDPEVHEIELSDGTTTVHERDVTSMELDGNDIVFAEGGNLYRAPNADLSGASLLGTPATTLLGVSADFVFAVGGQDAERAVRRFPKAGGAGEVVRTLGNGELAALASDAIVFTHTDGARHYVCTVTLAGASPTIHGYVDAAPQIIAADAQHAYATVGFNLVRLKR